MGEKLKMDSYLLVENWFGLSTITRLFPIIAALPLYCQTILPLLILSNLVQGVLSALLGLAVGLLGFWNVNLQKTDHVKDFQI